FFLRELKNVLEKASVEIEDEYRDLDISVEKHVLECEEINSKKIIESFDFQRLLWIGKIAWWVDRRKQYNLIANHHLGLRLEYLCQKYSFKYEDAAFLTPAEIDKVISGNLNISDFSLNERKNGGILLYDYQGKEIFLVGDEASKVWKNISSDVSRFADAKEIKGKTGFRGLVSGKVRIIMDAHNSENFQEGEILVTGMTRPDFLQLMKLAAAIITDEGGITCHAAIVAREMKKPCIIGTKIATKVLCDGDFVEIDAENGIVRITKKN
ncbi:MAG: hypothetical protein HGA61_03595, partial [Candidatus Moranbacteria bacterium]|nr:hypothetical protein [Candidatus Moranbacteria bacterium]